MKISAKQKKQLFDQIFELKFLNKQAGHFQHANAFRPDPAQAIVSPAPSRPPLHRQLNTHAKKCQVEERTQQRKAKSALDGGNTDIARTYATNAVRKKKEALEYIQLASRLDAVIARLNQQHALSQVDASASTITKSINKLLKKATPDSMANNMLEFQSAMEELDKGTAVSWSGPWGTKRSDWMTTRRTWTSC
jgi:phage shock protein A